MRLSDPEQLSQLLGIPFSAQQLAAISAPLEPAVIIAGAGSGKTTVMAARVVWLVGSGQLRADQVLGLTFTRKAAGELAARIRSALIDAGLVAGDEAEELILTYDAFAGRLVAEHGLMLGIEADARMITAAARFRVAARVVAQAEGPFEQLSARRPDDVAARLLRLSAELRSHLVTPAEVVEQAEQFIEAVESAPRKAGGGIYAGLVKAQEVARERAELAGLVVGYEQLKAELGYVEFADQMAQAATLAETIPAVSQALRQEFGVVLLDEYQDTSAAQARLLRAAFSGSRPATGRGHPVTAVGDPCQAIYGWRGAAASNILEFAAQFPHADGRPAAGYALTVNRRSGQNILDAANRIATAVRAEPGLLAQGVELDLVAPAQTPAGRVEAHAYATWPQEVSAITDRIADLHATGQVAAWDRIAVLCRRNSQVAELYAALSARDIPAEIVGLGGLLDLPAIADVVATLKVLDDATANPSLIRLLTSPRWAIGVADLALLGRRARELARDPADRPGRDRSADHAGQDAPVDGGSRAAPAESDGAVTVEPHLSASLLEAVADPGPLDYSRAARQRFAEFFEELSQLRRHAGGTVIEIVQRVIGTLGLVAETEAARAGGSLPLARFVQAVADYAGLDAEASLSGLLAYLDAERDFGTGLDQAVVSAADSVKVLTVHKAKGLEWEVVFVPGLAAGVFPADRVTGNWLTNAAVLPYPLRGDAGSVPQLPRVENAQLTAFSAALTAQQRFAEDRLAYVAVTRARQLLVASTHSWAGELVNPRRPSAYFSDLHQFAQASSEPQDVPSSNPLELDLSGGDWPFLGDPAVRRARHDAAELIAQARATASTEGAYPTIADLDPDGLSQADQWRRWADQLIAAELRTAQERSGLRVPEFISVTGLSRFAADPSQFLAGLRRPMPRLVSEAQRWGIGFHRWLEDRFRQQAPLLEDEPDLELSRLGFDELRAGFEAGPYASLVPLAVEEPFTLVLGGRLIRGRIDAVFATGDGRAQVVDWKTGDARRSDPLQLACYRLAWAELSGLELDRVDAVFYDLRAARVVRPDRLPDRRELEAVIATLPGSLA